MAPTKTLPRLADLIADSQSKLDSCLNLVEDATKKAILRPPQLPSSLDTEKVAFEQWVGSITMHMPDAPKLDSWFNALRACGITCGAFETVGHAMFSNNVELLETIKSDSHRLLIKRMLEYLFLVDTM